jgi:hypothetical protein
MATQREKAENTTRTMTHALKELHGKLPTIFVFSITFSSSCPLVDFLLSLL